MNVFRFQRRSIPVAALFVALILALIAPITPAAAQSPAAGADAATGKATTEDLKALLDTIENEQKRTELAQSLRALIAARGEAKAQPAETGVGARLITIIADRVQSTSEELTNAVSMLQDVPAVAAWIKRQFGDPAVRDLMLRVIGKLAVVLAAAFVAGRIARMLLAAPRRALEARMPDALYVRAIFLAGRTVLDIVPIAVFGAVAYAVMPLTEPGPQTRIAVIALINAYVVVAAIVAVSRMILVPAAPGLRVLPLTDLIANYLFLWARRFTLAVVVGYYLAEGALLLGLPAAGHSLILNLVGLLVAALAVVFIMQNRLQVADAIRGANGPMEMGQGLRALRNRLADIWHALAIIYVVAIFIVWALSIEGGFEFVFRATVLTIVIFAIARALTYGSGRLMQRGFELSEELKTRYPTLEARANRYLPWVHKTIRIAVYLIALLAVLSAWGVDSFAWIETSTGRRILQAFISIVVIVVVALLFWEGVSSMIERYLDGTKPDGTQVQRSARARTLLPLLRNAVFISLLVMVSFIILSELGLNIGPLLAGAGVIGLAIGFGSQKLVQDVITGAFMLFEDAIAVGDVVRVAGTAGVVEGLSIRSIRLRDLSGNVHNIPFSAVDTVTNMTKEFSVYVFEVGIAYRENVDEVMAVLRDLGAEIQADADFGPDINEPLEILGLDTFGDSAIVIKARFKTQPGKQWMIGREFNRRIKNRFDELGIEIPFPHTTIYFGEDKDGTAPPLHLQTGEQAAKSPAAAQPASSKPEIPPTEIHSGDGSTGDGGGEAG